MPSFLDGHRLLLATSASAMVLLTACGGGGGADRTSSTEAATVADATGAAAAAVTDPAVAQAEPAATEQADPETAIERDFRPVEGGPEVVVQEGPDFTPALSESQANASVDGRESAQSLTVDAGDTGFAKPRVAAIDWVNDNSSARSALLAKYKLVVLGARAGSGSFATFVSSIKSRSSSTRLAYYALPTELPCSEGLLAFYAPAVRVANSADFWLHKAGGARSQWTTAYNHCDINLSKWGRKDSSGRTWAQYKAQFDWETAFSKTPHFEYVFSDNTFTAPRVDADWKRIGSNQSRTQSDVVVAQREGHVAYWNAMKAKKAFRMMGNIDGNLSQREYAERLNGAYMEGAMGKSWSLETWAGWSAMMDRYRGALQNTAAPNDVILQAFGDAGDYRKVRYGLTSALMDNGWFTYLPLSGGYRAIWYDEFDAPIGKATESPPRAAWSNGVYRRVYENGIVLVNPTTSSKTVNVGSAYKRLKGTQAPSINNGGSVTSVTVPPKDGLILIKR